MHGELPRLNWMTSEFLIPFYLHWANDGSVKGVSGALRRFWHNPAEEELGQLILIRPFETPDVFPLLGELTDMLLTMTHRKSNCRLHLLRCQVRDLGENGWLLVGQPSVSKAQELEDLGFTLSDLPMHLGLGDLLIANEAAQVSLRAAKDTEARLRETNESMAAMNQAFERFVPARFLEGLGAESVLDIELGRHIQLHGTVMFADLHGFTAISEAVGPSAIFAIINQYLSAVVPCIEDNGGVVIHYQGDGVIALFPGNTGQAIDAGIAMQRSLRELNLRQQDERVSDLKMSIGVHDGPVTLGVVGDASRWDASIISDAVNTAARIEAMTRKIGGDLLVSRSCLEGSGRMESYSIREMGHHVIRGKAEPVELLEVLDALSSREQMNREVTSQLYQRGLTALQSEDMFAAISAFSTVLSQFPDDKASLFFLTEASDKLRES